MKLYITLQQAAYVLLQRINVVCTLLVKGGGENRLIIVQPNHQGVMCKAQNVNYAGGNINQASRKVAGRLARVPRDHFSPGVYLLSK